MNLTDLRAVLDEYAGEAAPLAQGESRLRGVHGKVRAGRQRRAAVGVLATIVVLLIGYAVAARRPINGTPPPPATTPSVTPVLTVNGFAEYAAGAHLIQTRWAPLSDGEIAFVVDGNPRGWAFSARCDADDPTRELWIDWVVNGKHVSRHSCPSEPGMSIRPADTVWTGLNLAPERHALIVATVTTESGPLPTGTFAVAVSERMAFTDYPLPPRPATLRPLDPPQIANVDPAFGFGTVESDPADPTRPQTIVVDEDRTVTIDMISQTPGYLHVIVDGTELATAEWWDYTLGIYGVDVQTPGRHTITFVPDHLSGAWRAVLHR